MNHSPKEEAPPSWQKQGWLPSLSIALLSPKNQISSDGNGSLQSLDHSTWSFNGKTPKELEGDDIGRVLSYDSDDCSLDEIPTVTATRILGYWSSLQESPVVSTSFAMIITILSLLFAATLLVVPLTVGAALQFSSAVWPWVLSLMVFSYTVGLGLLCVACKCTQWLCKPILALVHYLTAPEDTLEWEIEVKPDYTVYKYDESSRRWRREKECTVDMLATILACGCCFLAKFCWLTLVLAGAFVSATAVVATLGCNMFC